MSGGYSRLAFSSMTDILSVCGEGSQGTGLPVNPMAITQDFVVRGTRRREITEDEKRHDINVRGER